MNWKLAVGLGVLALEGLAILYLCLPATAKRVKGIPFIAAGVIGSILGTALVIPPDVFREPGGLLFPFDPNDDAAASFFGPGGTAFADFAVGAAFPLLVLALVTMTKKRER
jgi:hypothetical protein